MTYKKPCRNTLMIELNFVLEKPYTLNGVKIKGKYYTSYHLHGALQCLKLNSTNLCDNIGYEKPPKRVYIFCLNTNRTVVVRSGYKLWPGRRFSARGTRVRISK